VKEEILAQWGLSNLNLKKMLVGRAENPDRLEQIHTTFVQPMSQILHTYAESGYTISLLTEAPTCQTVLKIFYMFQLSATPTSLVV
jgi:hypothetical protein